MARAVEADIKGHSIRFEYEREIEQSMRWVLLRLWPLGGPGRKARRYCLLAEEVTERKRSEQELARRNRELTALYGVNSLVTQSRGYRRMLRRLRDLLGEVTGNPGALFLASRATGRGRLRTSWGLSKESERRLVRAVSGIKLGLEARGTGRRHGRGWGCGGGVFDCGGGAGSGW